MKNCTLYVFICLIGNQMNKFVGECNILGFIRVIYYDAITHKIK